MKSRTLAVIIALLGATTTAVWGGSQWLASAGDTLPRLHGSLEEWSRALARARLTGEPTDLDDLVEAARRRCAAQPTDAVAWQNLAETLLERALARDQRVGMKVGQPVRSAAPELKDSDVDAGVEAAERSLSIAEDCSEAHRILAGLLSCRITGLGSAVHWGARIEVELLRAAELDPANPRIQVALGCRKLFAPRLLGHDPEAAIRHLLPAAEAMPLDERPLVFAAMAAHLRQRADQTRQLLERAIERNPKNVYAREVLRRIESGEADPFGRDVE
jgi:cytochrome c-type biogenesis protein CcmH/NrfG